MSCSLRWLSLTNVTTVASVELSIYIGLPSETHPMKCLGCIQSTSGKVSLAGGKLKMVLWIVPFLSTGPSCLCPLSVEKPQGAPLVLHCQHSHWAARTRQQRTCSHSSAFPSLGYRGGMLEVLNNERKLLHVQNPSATQVASFMEVSHYTLFSGD